MKVRINNEIDSEIPEVLACRGKIFEVAKIKENGMYELKGTPLPWFSDEFVIIKENKKVNFFINATKEINEEFQLDGLTDDEITEKYKEWLMEQEFTGWYEV